jgi:hypothetical protein
VVVKRSVYFFFVSGKDIAEVMAFGGFRANAHYKRSVCYEEKGEHSKAVVDFKEAVRLGPDLANNEDLKKRMNKAGNPCHAELLGKRDVRFQGAGR